MTSKQFAAALGFAFIAAWVGFGFGDALLCLLGALVGYLVWAVRDGEIDLGELQSRMTSFSDRSGSSTSGAPTPKPRPKSRVQ